MYWLIHLFDTELVLKQEQEEYLREGITWQNIEYFNNQIICDLVEQPHKGIMAIIDEACLNVGKVTDQMLIDAMDQKLAQHQHYTSRKLSPMDKELRHGSDFRIRFGLHLVLIMIDAVSIITSQFDIGITLAMWFTILWVFWTRIKTLFSKTSSDFCLDPLIQTSVKCGRKEPRTSIR